jgi:hypothetical protein
VWTHSLLLSRAQVAHLSASSLISVFRRPQHDSAESAAMSPLEVQESTDDRKVDGFADQTAAASLVGVVLGQARPVIVAVEKAAQLEPMFLRLWEELGPAARARFSFCTGALMPRSVGGSLMDLQAVPRAIPSSQFRKSAGAALVTDFRTPGSEDTWVKIFLDGASRGDSTFRVWLDDAAGANASRSVVANIVPLFGAWYAPGSSARSVLASIVQANELSVGVRSRLIGMLFDRANAESGVAGRRELLQDICVSGNSDIVPIVAVLEEQTRRIFEDSRSEGIEFVLSLLGSELTKVGERLLRAAIMLLIPDDVETFGDAQAPFLPTIVGTNHELASSPIVWSRFGSRSGEVLSQLVDLNMPDEARAGIVDAMIASGREVSVDALIRFGGKTAIFRGLSAIAAGRIQLSWPWRSALGEQRDAVLEWLEGLAPPSLVDLDLGSRFVSPKYAPARLLAVWKAGVVDAEAVASRVGAFGLTLAFWEGNVKSLLFPACFQPTYDAAGNSRLEYDEWDWVRQYAPSSSYWRDWDKCERLAKALALLLERQGASLDTVFAILRSYSAIKKVSVLLDEDRTTRPYLKELRMAVESSSLGTRDQRDALLEH